MLKLSLRRRRQLLPYLFLVPGLLWLIIFFLVPLLNQAYVSLQSGDSELGYTFTWNFSTYSDAISNYHEQFLRSLKFAGIGVGGPATQLASSVITVLAMMMAPAARRLRVTVASYPGR